MALDQRSAVLLVHQAEIPVRSRHGQAEPHPHQDDAWHGPVSHGCHAVRRRDSKRGRGSLRHHETRSLRPRSAIPNAGRSLRGHRSERATRPPPPSFRPCASRFLRPRRGRHRQVVRSMPALRQFLFDSFNLRFNLLVDDAELGIDPTSTRRD